MPQIQDISTDKSLKGLVEIVRHYPQYYDMIKTAEVDYSQIESLPDRAFAWCDKRVYPINTAKMAAMSILYRQYHGDFKVPKHVDQNLEKAAFLYDIEMPEPRISPVEKVASLQDEDYLLPSLKKFPVRNAKDADFVQNIIIKNAHTMGYDHLMEASSNLVRKYASFKVATDRVNPLIYKYAGLTLSNRDLLEASINRRLDFVKKGQEKPYRELCTISMDMEFNRENLLRVSSVLERLDKVAKVRHLYDKYIPNPIDSVFNTEKPYAIKVAYEDSVFSPYHASTVTPEQIQNLLGSEVLKEATINDSLDRDTLAEVVNSLPIDMVRDFVERIS